MIIVEGPDGGGKTTLIREIQGQLDIELGPRASTSDWGVNPHTLRDWVDQDLSTPCHLPRIYDRYPLISEPIYGPLIRGFMARGFDNLQWFASRCAMLRERDCLMVFCLPPLETVCFNIQKDHGTSTKHLRGVRMKGRAIYEQYIVRCALEAATGTRVLVWDYTKENPEVDFKDLLYAIERYA